MRRRQFARGLLLGALIAVPALTLAATPRGGPAERRMPDDTACTKAGQCVIVVPVEDDCPAYTGNVEPIQGGGVVCFPG